MELNREDQQYIENLAKKAKTASVQLRGVHTTQKNAALAALAELLDAERSEIKLANSQDVENAQSEGLSDAMIDRLVISDKVIDSMITSLHDIIALKDPVGEVVSGSVLPNGLDLRKIRTPIGVVAIIYESRPNVTVDVGALGLKSSNAVILRGGKEAIHSNKILSRLFQKALHQASIPIDAIQLVEHTRRVLMVELLRRDKEVDLVVPRGGAGLIRFVSENSIIPVVKHDKGVCHVYVHHSADQAKAIGIAVNSKVQRPGVCNAAETLIVDQSCVFQKELFEALREKDVILRADAKTRDLYPDFAFESLGKEGYDTEYLALEMSVKIVDSLEGAISHIEEYSSAHSEAIIAEDFSVIQTFLGSLDSAALFVNASTRFHDGGQFGLGAEVGISTQKLHCRGPMGLSDLTTTKYIVTGNGQIRE